MNVRTVVRRFIGWSLCAALSGAMLLGFTPAANAWWYQNTVILRGQVNCVDVIHGSGKVMWFNLSASNGQSGFIATTPPEPEMKKGYQRVFTNVPGDGMKVTATWLCSVPTYDNKGNMNGYLPGTALLNRTTFDAGRHQVGANTTIVNISPNNSSVIQQR